MSWTYAQSSGQLRYVGLLVTTGYAGCGDGKNNPAMQQVKNVGPLPVNSYTIGKRRDDTHLGPCVFPLIPDPAGEMYGRGDFWMHGENPAHPGRSSNGCPVIDSWARHLVEQSVGQTLKVIP